MENPITIYPNSKADASLYRQLAKRLHSKFVVTEEPSVKSKERISDDPYFDDPRNIEIIEEGIRDMKAGRVTEIKNPDDIWESI